MADARLRDLERRAALGDAEAGAQLLQKRVQVGDLGEDRLRLAAYLGDPGAARAMGDEAPESPEDPEDLAEGLAAWGPEACALASVAAARAALFLWEEAYPRNQLPHDCLNAVEAWATCPSDARYIQIRSQFPQLPAWERDTAEISDFRRRQVVHYARSALSAVHHTRFGALSEAREAGYWACRAARDSVRAQAWKAGHTLSDFEEAETRTRLAIQRALIPWALADSEATPPRKSPDLGALQLPLRIESALRRGGLKTIEDLSSRTWEELLALWGIGPRSKNPIEDALENVGLTLRSS